ncbi:DUF2958 domain-containing protein [Sphingomonas histidinilytica]|mgnify:CR=1 FL=1|jgi:hypothetical protein|uniref:DUF2958 domain-containing protein n=1 Tax=Rhizorhabdus histidinilytica TaxID=439228 RepID=UPI001ADA6ACD|nr:DUF2958 domain-containing protein [Rhizorhabdus histidinilytica]MBO9376935.1 DUF2958 domain-containing protein [Rhizorhabdus histidinilytica]
MILVTPELRDQLRANHRARREALRCGEPAPDSVPVVRFFNPLGPATWLATELDEDGILFGLADLGFGCPELGSFALEELESIQLPFGLGIERDVLFEGEFPLSVYAKAAARAGSLVEGERILRRGSADTDGGE